MSIILTVFSKPVTMYLDPMLIGIIILVLILSIVFPRIGSFIGLSSALKSATDSKSKPDDKAGVAVEVEKTTTATEKKAPIKANK